MALQNPSRDMPGVIKAERTSKRAIGRDPDEAKQRAARYWSHDPELLEEVNEEIGLFADQDKATANSAFSTNSVYRKLKNRLDGAWREYRNGTPIDDLLPCRAEIAAICCMDEQPNTPAYNQIVALLTKMGRADLVLLPSYQNAVAAVPPVEAPGSGSGSGSGSGVAPPPRTPRSLRENLERLRKDVDDLVTQRQAYEKTVQELTAQREADREEIKGLKANFQIVLKGALDKLSEKFAGSVAQAGTTSKETANLAKKTADEVTHISTKLADLTLEQGNQHKACEEGHRQADDDMMKWKEAMGAERAAHDKAIQKKIDGLSTTFVDQHGKLGDLGKISGFEARVKKVEEDVAMSSKISAQTSASLPMVVEQAVKKAVKQTVDKRFKKLADEEARIIAQAALNEALRAKNAPISAYPPWPSPEAWVPGVPRTHDTPLQPQTAVARSASTPETPTPIQSPLPNNGRRRKRRRTDDAVAVAGERESEREPERGQRDIGVGPSGSGQSSGIVSGSNAKNPIEIPPDSDDDGDGDGGNDDQDDNHHHDLALREARSSAARAMAAFHVRDGGGQVRPKQEG